MGSCSASSGYGQSQGEQASLWTMPVNKMFVSLQHSYVGTFTLEMMALGGGAFGG